ncbi:hypothetical protein F3157_16080 [Virgibacillus dakarensis]|uniref:hypothetical protein n=1 Tax=Virgibacillus dakarensis TaxID=1917889 RepID=UPI0012D9C82E|nr:hypothetical protein [Virgibacillus dakarensis]MTW87160.1 hypothetical protein [Virgibacillus dakarensis]
MELFIAIFPLLFWMAIIALVVLFIVKKVKKTRRELEERIASLEERQNPNSE